jgi:hypothetical protein
MTVIINFGTTENLDTQIIPQEIYDMTLNKETEQIQNYFILHPKLMYSFVGYNGALKLANQLSSNKKCGCFYNIPWKTHYDYVNNTKETTLSFSQQVDEYRYMIQYWIPSPKLSYMQYLSEIALRMVLDISQYMYYISNNLDPCFIYQKKYYHHNFKSERAFRTFVFKNFANINKKYVYNLN